MESEQIKRAPYPEHPDRCQHVTSMGQCLNLSIPNTNKCAAHSAVKAEAKRQTRMYKLHAYKQRLDELSQHENIYGLRDEIALTRILIEEMWNRHAQDTDSLMLIASPLGAQLDRLQRLVPLCQKLEKSYGALLSKAQVIQIASKVIDIVSSEITLRLQPEAAAEVMDKIAESILGAIDESVETSDGGEDS